MATPEFMGLTVTNGHNKYRRLTFVLRRKTDVTAGSVLRCRDPRVAPHPAIEALRQLSDLSRLPLVEHQAKAVALVSGARLREIGDVFPIGRVARRRLRAGGTRDFRRREMYSSRRGLRLCHGRGSRWQRLGVAGQQGRRYFYYEHLVIRARRFDFINVAGISDLFSVGRPGVH